MQQKCQQKYAFDFVENVETKKCCKIMLTNSHAYDIMMMLADSHGKGVKKLTNGELLRKIFEEKGFTKVRFADEIGLSRQGLDNKLNGIREFKQSEIAKISTILSLTKEQEAEIFFASEVGLKSQPA